MTSLQAEVVRAQEDASREKEARAVRLEEALRESRAARAEADVLRGQLEEARSSGAASASKAEELGQKLAAAEARLRVLEQQAEAREAEVGGSCAGSRAFLCQGCQPQGVLWDLRVALALAVL